MQARTRGRAGPIHIAINCAGIGSGQRTVGKEGPHRSTGSTTVIRVNLIGTFNVVAPGRVRHVHQCPDESGERGVIINTASVAAFDGQIGQAAYSASKGGIVGMTLPMARDLARFGFV